MIKDFHITKKIRLDSCAKLTPKYAVEVQQPENLPSCKPARLILFYDRS